MKMNEKELQVEIAHCLIRIRECREELLRNYDNGVPLSSSVMVGLGCEVTDLGTRLVELDRQYEELILRLA